MKAYSDDTSMGGASRVFETTDWTRIQQLESVTEGEKNSLLEPFARSYWKPVYCYLRRKGYDNDSAKDLTQGFFCEVLLGRELIGRADRLRGRFRDYLVRALENYVTDEHRSSGARKRSPQQRLLSLDTDDLPPVGQYPTKNPEQAFYYSWATTLLDNVLAELKRECYNTGKETHWRLFEAAVLRPLYARRKPLSLSELCQEYGIESEQQISNMLVTAKRRFRAVLGRTLHRCEGADTDTREQLSELIEILSRF